MKEMRLIWVILISTVFVLKVNAQNRPQFSLYNMNTFLINPAITGAEEFGDLRVGYRNQWQGLSGAPETYYVSFHTPVGASVLKSKSRVQGYQLDPFAKAATNRPATIAHHGVGGMVLSDNIGPFQHVQVSMSYAYHLSLTEEIAISAGASIGFAQNSIDYDQVVFENDQDQVIGQGVQRDRGFDGSLGLWMYSQRFFLGISGMKKFSNGFEVNSIEVTSDQQQLYLLVSGGYKFTLSKNFSLMPNTLIKYRGNTPVSFDVGVTGSYRDRLWLGAAYRNDRSILALVRFGVTEVLDLGYSYDFATTEISSYGTGSHELVLGLKLPNKNTIHSRSRFF
ncbi:MAG: hypothetical protein DHS20C17_22600 [Cyclobacteriaceae bacterium]|nr:MAG: hypothetical protein DHS20C17_22600 [Cyclobacteriaceae bacterium]